MSLATLPATGESIGSGGFGEVFLDPTDRTRCIKRFTRPVKGPAAVRLLDIVELPGRMRPSERALLMSRFAWPLELFGNERKLSGHRMLLAPESAMFDLIVAGRASMRLLQAMYVLDASFWDRTAVQSEKPFIPTDGRLLVIHDLIRAIGLLHDNGFAYVDLSAKNVCIANGEVPRVFLLDADSVVPTAALDEPDVRTVDWEVDERLSLPERDWVKVAMFAWRLLLEERLARPRQADIADFDRRVGVSIGAAIARLHDQPDGDSAAALSVAIRTQLGAATQDALIEYLQQQGFARDIVAFGDLTRMPPDLLAAAEEQLALEQRVENSSGLQRRLLARGLQQEEQRFALDVLGGPQNATAPRSAAELERLVLEARFEEMLDHFVDGQLTHLATHPWRDRALQHALVLEPEPVLEVSEAEGVVSARFLWPDSPVVDVAQLRIWTGRDLIDERLIDRQLRHPSVRIRGIGAGLSQGTPIRLQLTFGVRSDDGSIAHCPGGTTVALQSPEQPVRQQSRIVRTPRDSASAAGREPESLVDVARPDADPAARRRRRRNRSLVAAAGAVLIAASALLLLRGSPQSYVDAAALATPQGTEVVWSVRSAEDFPSSVERFVLQRRFLGLVWIRESETASEADRDAGEMSRVFTDASGPVRVAATLRNGERLRSEPLEPVPSNAVASGAPDAVQGLRQESREGGAVRIGWSPLDVGSGRIVERYQVMVLDTTGRLVGREQTGNPGWTIARRDVLRAPLGLDVRVRAIASDGSRSPWATLMTSPTDTSSIPRPSNVELRGTTSGERVLRWQVDPVAQGIDVPTFQVSVVDVVADERRVLEVESDSISAARLFEPDGSSIRVVRVRSRLQDGATGPWSNALIVRRAQTDSAR